MLSRLNSCLQVRTLLQLHSIISTYPYKIKKSKRKSLKIKKLVIKNPRKNKNSIRTQEGITVN